ncbi:MAG TPA: Na/Pi symporter [Bacillales bacterium]|nr:Na/Pi symporter [Bacillales bacterium]
MFVNEFISLFAVLIAVFVFGITVMRLGLESMSKRHIQTILLKMTDRPWKSFLIGIGLTALIQSSSAVMIITIGLLAAGIIRFKQTIGIILGANVGTTITVEMITLDISDPAILIGLLVFGAGLLFFRSQWLFSSGCVLFGLGAVFTSINGLEELAEPLANLKWIHHLLLITNNNHLAGAAVGSVFTAIIQSSSAATAIAMAFVNKGQLSLEAGVAIVLGANIGTCFTAWLASFRANLEAKLASYAHIGLNVAGVILFLPFINFVSEMAVNLSSVPSAQLAHISVLFNVFCSLAALPFTDRIARFFYRISGSGQD